MRRLSLASLRRTSVIGRPCGTSLSFNYGTAVSPVSASELVGEELDINTDLPEFRRLYEDSLKRLNITENSRNGQILKEATKLKFVGLEDARVFNPEQYAEDEKALAEIETAIQNYKPSIQPTVDEAFDSKNHPFVTDSVGAEIFLRASAVIDKQAWVIKTAKERLGITPRALAEEIWELADSSATDYWPDPEPEPTRGDLPAHLVRFLDKYSWGSSINSKKEFLDKAFPSKPTVILDACSVEALKNGREAGIAVRFAEAVKNEGLVKGTPEYEELEKHYKDFDPYPLPGQIELQEQVNAQQPMFDALRKRAELELEDDSNMRIERESQAHKIRYHGENGVARRAVNGFLFHHPSPSDEEKIKFMKTLRDAIRAQRKAQGFVLRELYPTLNLPLHRPDVGDAVLLERFDYFVGTL